MTKELPLWLIERIEDIDSYIGILQAAKQTLFSLSISPVDILTDIAVDLILKLKYLYRDEAPLTGRPNPEIIFDELGKAGPLGNSTQITRKFNVKRVWNPQLREFLNQLAIFFSRTIKQDFNFDKDFVRLIKSLNNLPPGLFISQKSIKAEKRHKNINPQAQRARTAYYRRRHRK